MTAAIAKWLTPTGIRRTSPADTLSVDLEAYTDLRSTGSGGEGGIDRVEFSVVVNGGSADVTTVSSPALRFPNFSEAPSPLPGAAGILGGVKWAYGVTLDCAALAAGTVVVSASIFSVDGTETPMSESVTLYNDSDLTDRRPCTEQIFVSPTGDDGDPGTELAPVATIRAAVVLAHDTGDMGGAEIVLLPGTHDWAGGLYGQPTRFTSGDWWVTFRVRDGAVIQRTGGQNPNGGKYSVEPDHYLYIQGNGPGTWARVRFILESTSAKQVIGGMLIANDSTANCRAWIDGGSSGSALHDSETNPWSVRFIEDDGQPIGYVTPHANSQRMASHHTRIGCNRGFSGWSWVQDCVVTDLLGIALEATGDEDANCVLGALIERQRYDEQVAGFLACEVAGKATVTNAAGRMRITQNTSTDLYHISGGAPDPSRVIDIAAQASELIGGTIWGVLCEGFANGANNGTFEVLAVGYDSGNPWVELDNPSAVSESVSGGGSARIWTALVAGLGLIYPDYIHPDVLQYNADRTGCIHSHIAVRDWTGGQIFFTSGHDHTRCVIAFCGGGASTERWNFEDSSLTDCLFFHNTANGPWDFTPAETFTRCNFVGNVIRTTASLPDSGTNLASHNHFISGSTFGSSPSSGTWFAGDPDVDPWMLTPTLGNTGTASTLLPLPAELRFTGASGDSRGVTAEVGEFDWSGLVSAAFVGPPLFSYGTSLSGGGVIASRS